jgi:hypothetical protein
MTPNFHDQIQDFVGELSGFALKAESTLSEIEADLEGKKSLFSVFSEKMFAIRGSADQLNLPHIAKLAGLSEEIALKGAVAERRPQIRRCVGSLWDALTTVKYLLQHYQDDTNEEQEILIRRLEDTLRLLGGPRESVSQDEIAELMKRERR